jgi:DNA mismatch repair protein MutS
VARVTRPEIPASSSRNGPRVGHRRTPQDQRPSDPPFPTGHVPTGHTTTASTRTMPVPSVLWLATPGDAGLDYSAPSYFSDLNLDQVVEGAIAGLDQLDGWDIRPVYYRRLSDQDEVRYRQEVFADLEQRDLLDAVSVFADAMRAVRRLLATAVDLSHPSEAGRWYLDAAWSYLQSVDTFAKALVVSDARSRAMRALSEYVAALAASERFGELRSDCAYVRERLASVRYCVHVRGSSITVTECGDEPDYSAELQRSFARFRKGVALDYRVPVRDRERLDHVEAQVLDRVAMLFASEFTELEEFRTKWKDFVDPVLDGFDREVTFYLAYLSWIQPLRSAGLPMCYPEVVRRPEESGAHDSFDLVLARKLVAEGGSVATNDLSLAGEERMLVVTGPNQGGKTTFARMFGQLHHLAALGCPVPGTAARLRLCGEIFTHFQREEDLDSTAGQLEDDLRRIREILLSATADSVLVVNEIFTSTTLRDASFLGRMLIERACEIGLVGVYVTFVDELASLNMATVSMVSTVDPGDPSIRTFKLLRRPADGRTYAVAIARKYGVSYEQLAERFAR